MPISPVGLGLRSNPGRDGAISAARLINCYVENVGEEGKLQVPLVAADSFTTRSALAGGGAVAGMLALDASNLYVVSGNKLFKNTSANVTSDLGTVTNSGWVAMARNRKATPQIGILTDAGVLQVLESDTLSTVSQAYLTGMVDFLSFDGYGIIVKSNGEVYLTSIDDFTTVDELQFTEVKASPHGLLKGATRGSDVVFMGPRAMAFYNNTGNTDFPLERAAVVDLGCYAPRSVQEIVIPGEGGTTDSVIWCATDSNGAYIGVMAMSGYGGSKISNGAVDRAVKAESTINNIRSTTWAEGGHTFYALHTSAVTWVYDTATQLWHERASAGAGRWRVAHIEAFDGVNVAGDYSTAVIYDMGPSVSNSLACAATVSYSNDNGDTWSTARSKDIGGASARQRRFKWTRFGRSKEDGKLLRIAITNAVSENGTGNDMVVIPPHLHGWPSPIEIHAVYVDVVPGSSETSVTKAITGLAADVTVVAYA